MDVECVYLIDLIYNAPHRFSEIILTKSYIPLTLALKIIDFLNLDAFDTLEGGGVIQKKIKIRSDRRSSTGIQFKILLVVFKSLDAPPYFLELFYFPRLVRARSTN